MEYVKSALSPADYIVVTLMLLMSASIGLYFRFTGGKQKTINEYLLGGKNMPILPVAFSIMASYLSAVTIIGVPAEVYLFGLHMLYSFISYPIGVGIASCVCLPVFFKLGSCTTFEYLEKRFGKLTRTFTSLLFVFQTMLYMSVVLYAPALALSAVTSLSTWTSVLSVGLVCTFYCTLGGIKAVLWTDLLQALLMFIGILAVLSKGLLDIGFIDILKISYDGGRIPLPGFSLNLNERYTVWNLFLQGCMLPLIIFGTNQIQVQRLLTLKNISRCRKSLYIGMILYLLFLVLTYSSGLVIYANFYKCDPLTVTTKPISAADQLMPYYIVKSFGSFPGLPGLCICGIFGASLSTVSSAMNSLAAVTMQDLIGPFLESRRYSESSKAFCAKALTLLYGMLCILTTVLASSFGTLVQAVIIIHGMCGVPVVAVFLLGMLTTRANEKGVLIGLLFSLCLTAWVGFGAAANGPRPKILPVSTDDCLANSSLYDTISSSVFNSTLMTLESETSTNHATLAVSKINDETPYIFPLYRISYLWYSPFALLIGFIVGYLSSIIISRVTGDYPDVAEELLSPVLFQFSKKKKILEEKDIKIPLQEAENLINGAPRPNSINCE